MRVYSIRLLNSLSITELMTYLYACVYDCSTVVPEEQFEDNGGVGFPTLRVSARRLVTSSIYLAGIVFFHFYLVVILMCVLILL